MDAAFFFLFHFAVIAYALVGGVFLAFSDFIMRSAAVDTRRGIPLFLSDSQTGDAAAFQH